jgi:signal transduction histidine kinase
MSDERGPPIPSTWFLSAERASDEALADQIAFASANPVIDALLRTWSGALAVLNEQRQIVALNGSWLELVGAEDAAALLGLRPGEAMGCAEAARSAGGCATGQSCASCGAAVAIVSASARQQPEERDCVVSVLQGGVELDLDLRVRAMPLELEGRPLTLVALHDVSSERRRAALERAFFHELTNLVAGLVGASGGLEDPDPAEARGAADDVRFLAARLSREVQLQRALSTLRPGAYRVKVERVAVAEVLERLERAFRRDRVAAGKALAVAAPPAGLALDTDAFLLQRLVTQMLTNAFEATGAGGEVRLWAEEVAEGIAFRTWNAGAIPAALASRVFHRYFSTKPGEGRGLGTYALKLFGEGSLAGRVGFTSTPEAGTTFELRLPRSISAPPPWQSDSTLI